MIKLRALSCGYYQGLFVLILNVITCDLIREDRKRFDYRRGSTRPEKGSKNLG